MPPEKRPRVALVLFNLGGPDRPEAIRPFLLNLFRDPAILRVPLFVRPFLSRLIANRRVGPASENYAILGGRSPLLELTQKQAVALEQELREWETRCFIAMRYWHPFSLETAQAVREWDPDEVILLPLYPQFSTTTTGSSLTAWRDAAIRAGLVCQVTTICCYPGDAGFLGATGDQIIQAYAQAKAQIPQGIKLRVLFSAHGLPEAIVRGGDPYQWQIECGVGGIVDRWADPDLDWTICYQSRATPEKWLGPSTDAEIERAGNDGVAVLVVPIAFVSEHVETLVELDVEYRDLAQRVGVPGYFRVPTQNDEASFVHALANLARRARGFGAGTHSHAGSRICPLRYIDCPIH